jgi:hypothetical protein
MCFSSSKFCFSAKFCSTGLLGVALKSKKTLRLCMKNDFISVNECILDYDEYVKNIILLKNYLKNKLNDLMAEQGFEVVLNRNSKYHSAELVFYSKEKDLEAIFLMRKRRKEEFV